MPSAFICDLIFLELIRLFCSGAVHILRQPGGEGGRVGNLLTIADEGEEDRKIFNEGYKKGLRVLKKVEREDN